MVVLEAADYERIVTGVVDNYFSGVPLNDGVYKIACDMGLNPHQVRQVVWQANTKTHLALFEKRAEDKNVEFPVADADYIMRRMYTPEEAQPLPVAAAAEKTASDFLEPLVAEEPVEKIAGWADPEPVAVSPKLAAARREKTIRTLEKAAESLQMSVMEERELYMDGVYKLAFDLRKLADRAEFEKDAYALYGANILPVLNDLRSVYKQPALDTEKVASDYERLVDTRPREFKKLAAVKGHFDNAVKFAHTLKSLTSKLEGVK